MPEARWYAMLLIHSFASLRCRIQPVAHMPTAIDVPHPACVQEYCIIGDKHVCVLAIGQATEHTTPKVCPGTLLGTADGFCKNSNRIWVCPAQGARQQSCLLVHGCHQSHEQAQHMHSLGLQPLAQQRLYPLMAKAVSCIHYRHSHGCHQCRRMLDSTLKQKFCTTAFQTIQLAIQLLKGMG